MSEASWPAAVERVAAFLRGAGAEARLEELEDDAATAEAAAEAIGCRLDQIVKSLVLVCDAAPCVALIPGNRRADARAIARAVDARRARIATAAEVLDVTGFEPGGVAPFPLERVRSVLVDERLLAHRLVWAGAGSSRHMVALAPLELMRLTRGEPMKVSKE